jgi:sugar/nucleoside kinase (ribokinase family)
MSGTPRVVCIGIATVDAIVAVERLPASDERVPGLDGRLAGGGVAATAAVTLARLGVATAFVGRVGDDANGRWIRDELEREGVDVAGLRLTAAPSPVSVVLIEAASGLRSLAPYLGGGAPIEPTPADLAVAAAADWVHLDDLGVAVLPTLVGAGIRTPVSVDDGIGVRDVRLDAVALYAPTERVLRARFPGATLEASLVAALAAGPRLVAATLGEAGSAAAERRPDGRVAHHRAAPFAVPVASTLGAGDVFHGGLLAALVAGRPAGEALRRANATAALACRALDGRSAIPTLDELDAFLAAAGGGGTLGTETHGAPT